ncbi:unnamed protein product [Spodoptera littoralis]|uniref:Uncharacterized protein n=1 Tax=Spodoptera littoralis TaxID=7109 RepID=A0A9P0I4T1_SPOLI|nr:unnamed protein product [Spodoptera littoralis]CAH1639434.1 unnamed protein product [Spodoptera littoralis]
MSTLGTLPVILISSFEEAAAKAIVSELIDNDVTDTYIQGEQSGDRVWKLVNKYYTANVRVHILTDNGQLGVSPESIEAHIIHLTDEELEDDSVWCRRATGASGAWRRAAVRLVVADCDAETGGPLAAWSAAQRAELLAWRGAPPDDGPERARDALHAHVWPGLQREGRAARLPPLLSSESWSSSGGSDESDSEAEELRAVEQAEAFAAALGSLGAAAAARPPAGAGSGTERLDHAEALVQAFCRALGYDMDSC